MQAILTSLADTSATFTAEILDFACRETTNIHGNDIYGHVVEIKEAKKHGQAPYRPETRDISWPSGMTCSTDSEGFIRQQIRAGLHVHGLGLGSTLHVTSEL